MAEFHDLQTMLSTVVPPGEYDNKHINRHKAEEEEEEEHGFYWVVYNSGYSTEIVNEQCNTGDPLETSGG